MTTAPVREWPRAWWGVVYFFLYMSSLWFTTEGELAHWLSLVLIPVFALWAWERRRAPALSLLEVGRRLGLRRPERNRGIVLALVLAILLQGLQLMNRSQRGEVIAVLSSAAALWIVPMALVLVLLTAAFTEEFFFRGILQRSLSDRFRSRALGIVGASLAFALYHLPYAYLNPAWPSAGNLSAAIQLAFANGFVGGVVLGLVFARSRSSLIPPILLHGAFDWVPAIRLVAGWVGTSH